MKKKILYIGEPQTAELYRQGKVPSHWLYGAIEMEREGHEVIWAAESSGLLEDLRLVLKYKPDIIFIPNLNISNHRMLLAAKASGVLTTPIYAYLHHGRPLTHGLSAAVTRYLLSGINHIFFLSEKSMRETIEASNVRADRASCPGWGADINFYNSVKTSDKGYFISTGKENRDFDMLIKAFKITGAPLTIMTTLRHGTNSYDKLEEQCSGVDNIRLVLTENSGAVYPQMLAAMAEARALVCPLQQSHLDYCVGLSTIADAQGLRKPLIITANPYHDASRLSSSTHQVTSVDQWVDAIRALMYSDEMHPVPVSTMQRAWECMRQVIFS